MLRKGQVLFTYLHLAPDPEQTRDLLKSGVDRIAYETVTDARGGLPLLAPMSEVAGRLAPQVGAWTLQKANGGSGVLLGGVPGVAGQCGDDRRRRRRHGGGAGRGGAWARV
jgi:alanine dehydrogenase